MAFTPRTWVVGETVTAALMNQEIRDGYAATLRETMAWTAFSSLGSYGTNFSASTPAPRMRKYVHLNTEVWQYEGAIAASAFATNTTLTMFTFNASYRPAAERGLPNAYAAGTSHYGARFGILSTGALTASVPTASTSATKIWLDNAYITNPV